MDWLNRTHCQVGTVIGGLILVLLTGCASVIEPDSLEEPPFPALSVSFSPSDPALLKDCLNYSDRHAVDHCSLNMLDLSHFWRGLNATGQFKSVLYDAQDADYQLSVTTAYYSQEGFRDIAMSYLAGLTFTLYPLSTHHDVKAVMTLSWRDKVLRRYEYDMAFDRKVRLYYPGDDTQDFVDDLLARFMNDAERDGIFSQSYLYRVMNASNYQSLIAEGKQLGPWALIDKVQATSPYRGLTLRYEYRDNPADQYEVRIYPVARTDWNDLEQALLEEEQRIRHQQADEVLSQLLGSIDYGNSIFLLFEPLASPEEAAPLMKSLLFRGEITTGLGQRLSRDTYLFLKQDKIMQIKVTCAEPDCAARGRQFARTAVRQLAVPAESDFMAEVRRQHRRIPIKP